MKKFITLTSFVTTLVCAMAPVAAMAGADSSCHFHGNNPAAESVVLDCADKRKTVLLSNGKLAPTWQGIKHDKAELIDGKNGKEWKITYKNAESKDKDQQTLFMFFTPSGNFVAANFTGK